MVIGLLNSGIASGIGLVSEGITYRKQEKLASARQVDTWSIRSSPPSYEYEDKKLESSESSEKLPRESTDSGEPPKKKKKIRNPARLADDFLQRHPTPEHSENNMPRGRLSYPVILPQRRPKAKDRGFIRAYAPDLMNCGIDQDTFLDFLKTFTKASRAPMWMGAMNLASFASFAIPAHVASAGVSLAISVVSAIAIEMTGRWQANTFLRKLNEGFFQPRGLYCLVMAFDNTHENVMTEEALASKITSTSDPANKLQKYKNQFRLYSDISGPAEFPEAAPLVFPLPDWLDADGSAEQGEKLAKYKKFGKFVADYYDRRAQIEYASKHPDSPLAAMPQREFKSKYADPTNSTNLSPFSLVTNGYVKYDPNWRVAPEDQVPRPESAEQVFYLMVVNMPSDEDMRSAQEVVNGEAFP